jgi:hypothetical protein
MLALHIVIGVGIALLFPLLIYTGVATVKPPPKPSGRTDLKAETSEEIKRANRQRIERDREDLRRARIAYAKILLCPARLCGSVALADLNSGIHPGRADRALATPGITGGVRSDPR